MNINAALRTCLVVLIVSASCSKAAVEETYRNYDIAGRLEKVYAGDGEYSVIHITQKAEEPRIKQFQIWYPAELKSSSRSWPLVVLANGTGVPASSYEPIFRHLASWGFIVIGNEDSNSWDGLTTSISLKYMLTENQSSESVFYGKVDTDAVGLAGHSQGGVAVFNAATLFDNAKYYKALCAQSCTSQDLAENLQWPYSVEKVNAPTLLMAGAGNSDSGLICPLESMDYNYDHISGQPVMMGRLVGTEHGDVLKRGDAYLTAWFMYYLYGDAQAAECFEGDNAEMFSNTSWQDVKHKNL